MFDLEEALGTLAGKSLTFDQLRSEVTKIRVQYIADLPPEVGVNELISIFRKRDLVQEDACGTMHVCTR